MSEWSSTVGLVEVEGGAMVCWLVVGVVVLLEVIALAWPGPPPRPGGAHRSSGAVGAMRTWPGRYPEI